MSPAPWSKPSRAAGPVEVPFVGSARSTIGVEWEIALVDKQTRDLSNTAAEVMDGVGALDTWEIGALDERQNRQYDRELNSIAQSFGLGVVIDIEPDVIGKAH